VHLKAIAKQKKVIWVFNIKFPREACNPKRYLVKNMDEYLTFVNGNITSSSIYTNVYNFSNFNGPYMAPDYESAIIDRVYFDCDQKLKKIGKTIEVPAYENMLKIHNWCLERDIMHFPRCTGSAYDVIIATNTEFVPKNKKQCVANAQLWLMKELNIETDPQVIGDIARIHRVSNTFNHKPETRRFCIPLDEEIIELGEKKVFEIAKKQRFVKESFGSKSWDISEFDTEKINYTDVLNIEKIEIDESEFSGITKNIPDCIKNLLAKKDLGWKERRVVIIGLRENCFLYEETYEILKKHLTERKFRHCVREERQLQFLYSNGKYLFSNQDELIELGACYKKRGEYCEKAKSGCRLYGR